MAREMVRCRPLVRAARRPVRPRRSGSGARRRSGEGEDVKIEGRCRNCGRDFPIDLLLQDPRRAGQCPFCGVPIDQHYGAQLVDALEQLQRVGTIMTATLKKVESFGPNLEIDAETVLGPIRAALGAREEASEKRRRTEQASEAEGTAGLA